MSDPKPQPTPERIVPKAQRPVEAPPEPDLSQVRPAPADPIPVVPKVARTDNTAALPEAVFVDRLNLDDVAAVDALSDDVLLALGRRLWPVIASLMAGHIY